MKKVQKISVFVGVILVLYLLTPLRYTLAADQVSTYDKEQLKKDYKVFLQQLKSLNAQYREITGEIGEVMKEEGAPTWDMGDEVSKLTEEKKKEQKVTQDLGGGASLNETDKEMTLILDLPGYKKDSIKLSFQDGKKLLISARRKVETTVRSYERTFDLPAPGDYKSTSAVYEDGVLTIKIPKVATKEVMIPIK